MHTDTVGPRTAKARAAFALHFGREDTADPADKGWIFGYVAALEDLPDEILRMVERS
jgi:hypothetical protein